MACKWTFRKRVSLASDANLQKLVQFYVWETPAPDTSQKGTTFESLGWKGGSFNTLHAEMRKKSGFPNKRWIATTAGEVETRLSELNRLNGYDCSFEFAVHTVKSGLNKTEALFYFIRNAFAHGGFKASVYKGEKYYVFENRQDQQLKGRAILKESTLLYWRSLLIKPRGKQ